jgi:uncharacterized protein (TIGR02145 family)
MSIRARVLTGALNVALWSFGAAACSTSNATVAESRAPSPESRLATITSSKRMPDGRQWTTENLDVITDQSYCYDNAESNCRRYGRLYTWESAERACRSLGGGWRLPTNDEWRQMAKHYGGVRDDADDTGKAAYIALLIGGSSGFNAVMGGGRDLDGQYARLDAHGFYWTASESDPATAWFYNFGLGGQILNRHADGEKQRALSARCVRE